MSRLFVFADDMRARAEIVPIDQEDYGTWGYQCVGCAHETPVEESDSVDDANAAAGLHVDGCRKCVDEACGALRPHTSDSECPEPVQEAW